MALMLAWTVGCGDDDPHDRPDLSVTVDAGGDAGPGRDLGCTPIAFTGLAPPSTPQRLECPCGCVVDPLDGISVGPLWGSSHTSGASFVSAPGALGMMLKSVGALELCSLASQGYPGSQFFLEGDFDLSVDYDLGPTVPLGAANLILGVRQPGQLSGTSQYEVRRQRSATGEDAYVARLGGVPDVVVPTKSTHGTLRLTRQGYTVTAFADGQPVSKLIAQYGGRLTITLAATLQGEGADGGSCSYTPRWHHLWLAVGALVNQP